MNTQDKNTRKDFLLTAFSGSVAETTTLHWITEQRAIDVAKFMEKEPAIDSVCLRGFSQFGTLQPLYETPIVEGVAPGEQITPGEVTEHCTSIAELFKTNDLVSFHVRTDKTGWINIVFSKLKDGSAAFVQQDQNQYWENLKKIKDAAASMSVHEVEGTILLASAKPVE